jgi:predicted RecA/RadA family phage recombinase
MRNFVQRGVNVTVEAPANVSSGDLVFVGSLFGVAATDADDGADVAIATEGVFDLPKAAGAISAGAIVYWDADAKKVTVTATDNVPIGHAVEAAGDAAATARIRLAVSVYPPLPAE